MSARHVLLGALLVLGPTGPVEDSEEDSKFESRFVAAVELVRDGLLPEAAREFEALARAGEDDRSWQADFNAAWCRARQASQLAGDGATDEEVAFELSRAQESLVEALRRRQEPWLRESLEAVGRRLQELGPAAGHPDSTPGHPDRTGASAPGGPGAVDDSTSPGGPTADRGSAAPPGPDGPPRSAREVEAILEEILAEMRRRDAERGLPRAATGERAW